MNIVLIAFLSFLLKPLIRQYKYSNKIYLGIDTDFHLFLKAISNGFVYYDPGIKLEDVPKKPKPKRQKQFRIKTGHILDLYKTNGEIDLSL